MVGILRCWSTQVDLHTFLPTPQLLNGEVLVRIKVSFALLVAVLLQKACTSIKGTQIESIWCPFNLATKPNNPMKWL